MGSTVDEFVARPDVKLSWEQRQRFCLRMICLRMIVRKHRRVPARRFEESIACWRHIIEGGADGIAEWFAKRLISARRACSRQDAR